MEERQPPVGHLQLRDVPSAVGVLVGAFAADPVLTHYFVGARRAVAYRLLFGDFVLSHLARGQAHALRADGHLVAVALWSPPHPAEIGLLERIRGGVFACALAAVYPRAAREVTAGFEEMSHLHPPEPHWYLAILGVAPGHQGKGFGARLLAPVLAAADQRRQLCYLETPFPRTHAFYRRLGFEVTGEHHPFAGAPPIWTLVRQPGVGQRPAPA